MHIEKVKVILGWWLIVEQEMLTSILDAIDCIFRREENYARSGTKHFNISEQGRIMLC